jgi:hypothetical protein
MGTDFENYRVYIHGHDLKLATKVRDDQMVCPVDLFLTTLPCISCPAIVNSELFYVDVGFEIHEDQHTLLWVKDRLQELLLQLGSNQTEGSFYCLNGSKQICGFRGPVSQIELLFTQFYHLEKELTYSKSRPSYTNISAIDIRNNSKRQGFI